MSFFFFLFSFDKINIEKNRILTYKQLTMTQHCITKHEYGTIYSTPHFFILNKGLNSGKPIKTESPNSFTITFIDKQSRDIFFGLAYVLWQKNIWRQVVTEETQYILPLEYFIFHFKTRTERMLLNFARHQRQIALLKRLLNEGSTDKEQLKFIKQLRNCIITGYCRE